MSRSSNQIRFNSTYENTNNNTFSGTSNNTYNNNTFSGTSNNNYLRNERTPDAAYIGNDGPGRMYSLDVWDGNYTNYTNYNTSR